MTRYKEINPYHGIKDTKIFDDSPLTQCSAVVEQDHIINPQGCTERIVWLLEENINYLLFAGLGLVLLGGTLFSIKVFFNPSMVNSKVNKKLFSYYSDL